jgi:hypothetical protein
MTRCARSKRVVRLAARADVGGGAAGRVERIGRDDAADSQERGCVAVSETDHGGENLAFLCVAEGARIVDLVGFQAGRSDVYAG